MTKDSIDAGVQRYIDNIKEVCRRRNPLVVSLTITYNHEKYLRDALESIVMQQTDFPFVAIVHDDASTDGTAEILREYAEKYPDIILPIFESENQYSKGNGRVGAVVRQAREATGAKYVTMCEGDDYWTDPLKLQKQLDFMESHPEYSMVFGNAIEHWQDGSSPDKQFSSVESRDYTALEMLANWIVPTATVMYRREEIARDMRHIGLSASGKLLAGDILLFLSCAAHGKVKGMSDIFSVYRRLDSGVVRSIMDKQPYRFMIHEITLAKAFPGDVRKLLKRRIANRIITACKEGMKSGKINMKYVARGLWYAPMTTLRQLVEYL
ncbi:MAG: glycosyltransferase [Muribaculaceae bacterium]|nr:glycosyltransferase [Muribaculaceae bacterium]